MNLVHDIVEIYRQKRIRTDRSSDKRTDKQICGQRDEQDNRWTDKEIDRQAAGLKIR